MSTKNGRPRRKPNRQYYAELDAKVFLKRKHLSSYHWQSHVHRRILDLFINGERVLPDFPHRWDSLAAIANTFGDRWLTPSEVSKIINDKLGDY